MRGVAVLLLVLCLAAPARADGVSGLAPEPGDGRELAKQCPELVYTANPSYPPYHWVDREGRLVGASIDLLTLAAPPGVRLRPVALPWKRALLLAERGEIDLILSLRITPERSRYLLFAPARAFPNPIVVFVRRDRAFPFESWADLKGRLGGLSLGDSFGAGFDEYWRAELTMEEAKDMDSNFRKLHAGRIDYFVTSKHVGEAFTASHPEMADIVPLGRPISGQDIHFGFSRKSPCAALAEDVSRRLGELDRRGVPEQLLRKRLLLLKRNPAPLPK